MLKIIFPVIFILALELIPVAKAYSTIQSKYGNNLHNLNSQLPIKDPAAIESFAAKLAELQQGTETTKQSQPDYVF